MGCIVAMSVHCFTSSQGIQRKSVIVQPADEVIDMVFSAITVPYSCSCTTHPPLSVYFWLYSIVLVVFVWVDAHPVRVSAMVLVSSIIADFLMRLITFTIRVKIGALVLLFRIVFLVVKSIISLSFFIILDFFMFSTPAKDGAGLRGGARPYFFFMDCSHTMMPTSSINGLCDNQC